MKNTLRQFIVRPEFALFCLGMLVYLLSYRGEGKHWNYYTLLADAFAHGRTYLLDNPPWLNELITYNNHFYVVFPPMPAILLVPFVSLFGTNFPQVILSALLASTSLVLCYRTIRRIFQKQHIAVWMAILYGFGTIVWYHTEVASAWYLGQIIAQFFVWFALYEAFHKKRLYLIGLYVGAAYLSRLPTVFALTFFVVYFAKDFFYLSKKPLIPFPFVRVRNCMLFGSGIILAYVMYGIYNFIRFSTFQNIGYSLLPGVFELYECRLGLLNIAYIPYHMKGFLLSLPLINDTPPYVIPRMGPMAVWFTTPAFILAFFARTNKKLIISCIAAILAIGLVVFSYCSSGSTQFGYRYAMDFYPFLILLVASACSLKFNWVAKSLIILSLCINLWGVLLLSFFKLWSW